MWDDDGDAPHLYLLSVKLETSFLCGGHGQEPSCTLVGTHMKDDRSGENSYFYSSHAAP